MEKVFVYWDNSNIFIGAQELAERREKNPAASFCVRVNFENMFRLAHADRQVAKALAVGSIPPPLRNVWDHLRRQGVDVQLYDRGEAERKEQEIPDRLLQLEMLRDALDNNGDPGIAVLLTGDGAGYYKGPGIGFHKELERMKKRNWRIEVLSWEHSCNPRMRKWAEDNGAFVALDDFYDSITFVQESKPGYEPVKPRAAVAPDLSRRSVA
ncbi:MAG: NYN domain-containing protein [Gammaproteobacteria bacterium]